jgi:hypothetical protein
VKYIEALKYTAKQVLWQAPTERYMYSELFKSLKEFLWCLLAFVVRIIMFVLAPISIPLFAILVKKDEECKAEKHKEALQRIRRRCENLIEDEH